MGLRARLDRWAVAVERAAAPDLESRWAETDRWVDACLGLVALRHRLHGAVDVLATPRSSTEHTQSSRRAEDMLR